MYFAKEGFGTGFQSLVLPIYSFARLDRTRRLYQGLLRNVFNWLPSLITSQSSTKPTYWIQLQICPKLCQWSHSRGQIFGLNIQIRQWWMKQDDMTLSITKLVGHCLIHFSLEARSVFFCRHHLTEHYSVQRGIGGVFCRIHHLCEQSNCPVTTRLSSVAIKSCHRSSFPPHFAPFSKHSPSSSPRIESQINLYLKFNKQFDFEDDMQRTKANFAGCVFWNLKHLSKKGDRVHKSWNATRDVSHHSGGEAKRSVLLRRLNSSQWWFYSYRRHTLIITHHHHHHRHHHDHHHQQHH